MAENRADSPARTVVSRVAQGGHDLADYLARRGPDGVLAEVQEFARRRPGAFLATALVSGFVVGRLGRGVIGAAGQPPTPNAAPRDSLSQFSAGRVPDQPTSTATAGSDELVYSTSTGGTASGPLREAAR
jgi:hypothetical protein